MDIKKRLGVIHVSSNLLGFTEMNLLKGLFAEFYPVNIDRNTDPRTILFYGYSEHFDEIEEGEKVPHYDVHCTFNKSDSKESVTCEFSRANHE
jgi:hypothetical protein